MLIFFFLQTAFAYSSSETAKNDWQLEWSGTQLKKLGYLQERLKDQNAVKIWPQNNIMYCIEFQIRKKNSIKSKSVSFKKIFWRRDYWNLFEQ